MKYNKILVVDDNPADVELIKSYISEYGFDGEYFEAGTGEDAIRVVAKETPDLIILDVMLPGIDGFEACRQIKGNKKNKDIKVIMLTGAAEFYESDENSINSGADVFTTKALMEHTLQIALLKLDN